MSKKICNKSGETRNYAGQLVDDDDFYIIAPSELESFQNNDTLVADLAIGDATLIDTEGPTEFIGTDAVMFLLNL
jgi:hypothetical protein